MPLLSHKREEMSFARTRFPSYLRGPYRRPAERRFNTSYLSFVLLAAASLLFTLGQLFR